MQPWILFYSILLNVSITFGQAINFQLLDADNSNMVVANNQIFVHSVSANFNSVHNFSVNNTSASSQTVIVKRYIQFLNTISISDQASAPFSYNLINYPASTYSSVAAIAAGQNIHFDANLIEASIAGPSEVRYKFMDATDTLKAISIVMKYNIFTGINSSNLSSEDRLILFPNPVKVGEDLHYNIEKTKCSNIVLRDLYGKEVIALSEKLGNENKGTIKWATNELKPGLFFLEFIEEKERKVIKVIVLP